PEVTRPTRAADTTLADGTRIIEKPNGTRVTIYANGDRTLEEPGAPKITFKTDGRVQREGPDGKIIETRSKANTPLDERPLNVASGAFESIGKQLSNFARRPFVMDGKRYESVEAFYQGLKWSDPAQRAEIAKLYGPDAKSAGRGSKATEFEYEGQTIKFRSPEHYALMKRAITASLEQNPEILKEFQATHPRPIEHKTGRRENPNSGYPASVFTTTLNEVRAETLAKAGQSDVKPTATSGSSVEMTNNNPSKAVPISELLKSITNNGGNHNLQLYADAFKNSEFQASSVVASGGDALVLRLADGNIMKLTTRTSSRPQEPFDMPVLSSGVREVDGRAVKYFIQPEAKPATMSDLADFLKVLTHHGYRMTDPGIAQIGIYEGQIKLLDPYAVDRN
ncbi:MAG: hypothetical protein JSS86_22735, partial [Cyanobacteria bacterium SZAS LIN-2]|nr:hypothetical protein [Cyanobacteria bacterium SZAS LIN-2]